MLLYAGNLGYTQGLDALLDACYQLRDLPEFHCLIAGSGTAQDRLRSRAAQLSLRNRRFLGRRSTAEMGALMSIGDVVSDNLERSSVGSDLCRANSGDDGLWSPRACRGGW